MFKYLITISCFFISIFAFAQDYGIATYSIIPNYDFDKKSTSKVVDDFNSKEELKRKKESNYILSSAWDAASNLEFELIFDDLQSLSQVIGLDNENKDYVKYRNAVTFVGGKALYYQNKQDNITLVEKENKFLSEIFLVQDSLILLGKKNAWNITNEKKQIGSFLCVKATREYFYKVTPEIEKSYQEEVWFTHEVPVPFGPSGYGGLPGLVIEVIKLRGQLGYTIKLDKIKTNKKPQIKKPDGGKVVTSEDYFEIEYNSAPKGLRKKHTLNMKLDN